jgi:DNA-binding GntR family transcriptional regulator
MAERRLLYRAVAGAIRDSITAGHLRPGDQVGSSLRDLAARHHVGIATVRAALNVLADEGLVETLQGKGTFVTAAAPAGKAGTGGETASLRGELEELREEVRDGLGDLDARMMELYSRLGYEQPQRTEAPDEQTG